MHIELGDDGRYSNKGIGIFTFKRELGSYIHLKYVMYVPGMKKNLICLSILEDKGYDIVFSKGKAFLKHVAIGKVKQIGVKVKNTYKIEEDGCTAMNSKEEEV